VMGAFVFAAQMINFPVGAGTSGHLVGSTLLACVLGPEAAMLVVTSILLVQALIFQDGGILALGANTLNMALCGVLAGYLPYTAFRQSRWRYRGAFLGGVCSVMTSGLLALCELTISGIRIPRGLLLASSLLFLGNAIMEGAITATVLHAIERLNPELAHGSPGTSGRLLRRSATVIGLAALLLGSVGVLIASSAPDGLEHLAARLGLDWEAHPLLHAPLAGYEIPSLHAADWISKAGAGFLGLLVIYMVCLLASYLLSRARRAYSSS
jgi:cobalt/nickel transport system permease protein